MAPPLEAEDFFSQGGRVRNDNKATQGMCLGFKGPFSKGKPVLEGASVLLKPGRCTVQCAVRGIGKEIAVLRLSRSGGWQTISIIGGDPEDFRVSEGAINVVAQGVYGLSLRPKGKGLSAVDYILFARKLPI